MSTMLLSPCNELLDLLVTERRRYRRTFFRHHGVGPWTCHHRLPVPAGRVDWIRANGGVVVEVIRPGTKHVNEDAIPPESIDAIVVNDGTLEELGMKIFHTMGLLVPIA